MSRPNSVTEKEFPPKYNELYVPEIYLSNKSEKTEKPETEGDITTRNVVGPEPLNDILMCHDEFYLHQTSSRLVDSPGIPIFMHFRDEHSKLLMTVLALAGDNECRHRENYMSDVRYTGARFLDETGKVLMTLSRSGSTSTVISDDRILGVVYGLTTFSSRLIVKNALGEEAFKIMRKSSSSFGFYIEGREIGTIERISSDNAARISIVQGVDPQSKALILNCGYLVYIMYLATTRCGSGGTVGAGKTVCCLSIFCPFIFLLFMVALIFTLNYFNVI